MVSSREYPSQGIQSPGWGLRAQSSVLSSRGSSLGPWLQNTTHAEGPVPCHHIQLRCDSSPRHGYQTLRSKRLNHVPSPRLTLSSRSHGAAVPPFSCCSRSVAKSYPVLCDPHGLQHARLPCPSPAPGVCANSCSLGQ